MTTNETIKPPIDEAMPDTVKPSGSAHERHILNPPHPPFSKGKGAADPKKLKPSEIQTKIGALNEEYNKFCHDLQKPNIRPSQINKITNRLRLLHGEIGDLKKLYKQKKNEIGPEKLDAVFNQIKKFVNDHPKGWSIFEDFEVDVTTIGITATLRAINEKLA